jgi:hypothetical protein
MRHTPLYQYRGVTASRSKGCAMKKASVDCTFRDLLGNFSPQFTAPSFVNFTAIVFGWVLCVGRHQLSRMLQYARLFGWNKHHSCWYRFFSRAHWSVDSLGRVLLQLALPLLAGGRTYLIVDDTLARRSGPHLWGGGMHFDALQSTYGRGTSEHTAFSFGHNWVIVSLWVPLPWKPDCGIALPILSRLYRQQKHCGKASYRKRTELARKLLETLTKWLPADRKIFVLADSEYTCRTVIRNMPAHMHFIGPMDMDAAFYDFPEPKTGRGRPAKMGVRMLSPSKLAESEDHPWQQHTLPLYSGKDVSMLYKTQIGMWYHVAGSRRVRMVLTRDPSGRLKDRAYLVTDAEMTVVQASQNYAKRWPAESMHANVKQLLGAEEPQNGWWRTTSAKSKASPKVAGPQPHKHRGQNAVRRTFPCALLAYSLIVLWYFKHGKPDEDVQRVRSISPWYRHKSEPSFADMLSALRRHLCSDFPRTRVFAAFEENEGDADLDRGPTMLELLIAA